MGTEGATGREWRHLALDWAGAGAVLGAACWTVTSVLGTVVLGTRPYAATPFDVVELMGWTLMMGGLVGLPTALGAEYGRLGRTGRRAAAVGMALVAGLYVRAVILLVTAGFQLVPATGEDPLVLLTAYAGYGLVLVGVGLLGIALWEMTDRPTITAGLLVIAAVLPVAIVFASEGLLPIPGRLLLQSNTLLVPLGIAWTALGVLIHRRIRRPE